MAKGFGIAAVIVVVLSFFIPVVGVFITALAMVLASVGALGGDRVYATVTVIIGAVTVFVSPFVSPTIWLALATPDNTMFVLLIMLFLGLPLLAMVLNATSWFGLSGNTDTQR